MVIFESELDIHYLTFAAILSLGGYPSHLHYNGYPKSSFTSVNNISHGIPDDVELTDGDIVTVDVAVSNNVTVQAHYK